MSDCSNSGMRAYPALHLIVEFDSGDPWIYHLALNGRKVKALYVEGVKFGPVCGRSACGICSHSRIETHTGEEKLVCWVRKSHGEEVPANGFCWRFEGRKGEEGR